MSSSHKADPSLIPDIEAFEERAAIAQYDGRLTLDEAEDTAAQDQGFGSASTTGTGWPPTSSTEG